MMALFAPSQKQTVRTPPTREDRTSYPPQRHVELRFHDGTATVIDPRSPHAAALQQLAAELRQTRP